MPGLRLGYGGPVPQTAVPEMIRTVRRWPVSLAMKPWWDDPAQAIAMLRCAGMTAQGRPVPDWVRLGPQPVRL